MSYNHAVEEFRDEEYPMMKGKVYLDHGGTTIYSKSLIDAFSEKMVTNLYGNPHSASDPAKLSGEAVDAIREKALRFFKADPDNFDLVFVANASAAIKMVGESFRDLALASSVSGAFWYGYHKDAHTSVVGVREFAEGNQHCFISDEEVDQWLSGYAAHINTSTDGSVPGLFAFPGQSNMTGRRLPLSWTATLRQSNKAQHQNTYSLLDAAALATTTQLDLSNPDTAPDFTALSFYKIFGFPDLGALIIRKKSGHILSWRKYFGGGTVNMITVFHEATVKRRDDAIHEGLEDGTLPFHNIVALGCALDTHKRLYGSMKAISRHTSFLGHRLYMRLLSLTHYNGRPTCVLYNDVNDPYPYTDPKTQGCTVAFNLVRADGNYIRYSVVEKLANDKKIYLRAGGLCNPGGIASHLKVEPWQFKRAWSAGHACGDSGETEIINGKPIGVVRASLGAMSTIGDVDALIDFFSDTFVEHPGGEPAGPKHEVLTQSSSKKYVRGGTRHGSSNSNADDRGGPGTSRLGTLQKSSRIDPYGGRYGATDFNTEVRGAPQPSNNGMHQNSSRTNLHGVGYDAPDFDVDGRTYSISSGLPQKSKAGSSAGEFIVHDAGVETHQCRAESPNRSSQRPRQIQHMVPLGNEVARREANYDFNTDGRPAPRPPQAPQRAPHLSNSASVMNLRNRPNLQSMRPNLFARKSSETHRAPLKDMSQGPAEITGQMMTPDDLELEALIKQNLSLGSDKSGSGSSKGKSLKFWKGTGKDF